MSAITYKVNGKTLSHEQFLESGKTDGVSEIIATGSFPGLHTDDEFMANRGTLRDQLGDQTELVVKAAKKNGYKPSMHDVYLPSAARFAGDPEAFVKHDSAKGTLKRTFEKRGWACEGSVKVKGRQAEPVDKGLGDDLVKEEVVKLLATDKHARTQPVKDLVQHVKTKHGT